MGLVATVTSEAEPNSDSEDENEVYAKIPKEEFVESLKELLTCNNPIFVRFILLFIYVCLNVLICD